MLPNARVEKPLLSCILAIYDGRSVQLVRRGPRRHVELGTVEVARERGERLDTASEMLLRQVIDDDLPVVLRLTADQGLRTFDALPPISGDELRAVVANRLDILTPWSEPQVYFDARPAAASGDGQAEIEVTVVPRRRVDAAVEALAAIGLSPLAVDLVGEDPLGEVRYDLRQRVSFERPSRVMPTALACLIIVGLIIGGFVSHRLWQGGQVMEERQRLAAALERRLADVPALHARIEALRGEASYIFERRSARPSALRVIDELSAILPGDVWLTQLEIEGAELRAAGFSPDASTLLALIESSQFLSKAEFRSPSTRQKMLVGDDEVEVDAFSVAAALGTAGGEGP